MLHQIRTTSSCSSSLPILGIRGRAAFLKRARNPRFIYIQPTLSQDGNANLRPVYCAFECYQRQIDFPSQTEPIPNIKAHFCRFYSTRLQSVKDQWQYWEVDNYSIPPALLLKAGPLSCPLSRRVRLPFPHCRVCSILHFALSSLHNKYATLSQIWNILPENSPERDLSGWFLCNH